VKPPHVILTALATVVIFAAGVVTGGLLVRKTLPSPPAPQPGWPMARFDQFQRAVNTLDLQPEQRKKIRGIISERQAYVAEIMRVIEPDLPGLFVKLREDINQVLTPGQKRDLDQLWDRIQQRRMANRGGEFLGPPSDNSGFKPNPQFGPDGRRPMGPRGGELGPPRPNGMGPRQPGPIRTPPDRIPPDARPPPTNSAPQSPR